MKKISKLLLSTLLITFSVRTASAQETFESFIEAAKKAKDEGRIIKAIDELSWAKKELDKLHSQKLTTFFPAEVGGLKGAEPKNENVLGLMTLTRNYSGADTDIELTLVGASGSKDSASQGLGMFAGLAQMGMAMEANQPGNETIRLKDKTAILKKNGDNYEVSISLSNGNTITGKTTKNTAKTKDKLLEVMNTLDVAGIEKYLGGQ